MKKLLTSLTLSLLTVLVYGQILNGDFSKVKADGTPEDWKALRYGKQTDGILVDKTVCRSPGGAVRLRSSFDVQQEITLKPDTEYRFSCWYRTFHCDPDPNRDVKRWGGGNDLSLRSVMPDGKTYWNYGICRKYRGTMDWTRAEYTFNSSQLKSLRLRINLSMVGTVADGVCWFDDVKLEAAEKGKTIGRVLPIDYQQGEFWIAENMPGIPRLDFTGDAKKLMTNRTVLRMELPKQFRFIGAVAERANPKLPGSDPNYQESGYAKELTGKGAARRVFEMVIPNQMLRNIRPQSYNWGNCLFMAIAAEKGSAGASGKALLTVLCGGKEVYRYPFTLHAIAPIILPEKPCTMMIGGISRPASQYGRFPEVNEAYRKFWGSLTEQRIFGSDRIVFYRANQPAFYKESFFEWADYGNHTGGLPRFAAIVLGSKKIAQMPPLIDRDGCPVKGSVATWYIADDPDNLIWPAQRDAIKNALDKGGERIIRIDNNFETNVDMGYDAENIRRFAKFAKLKTTPTRQQIRSAYSEQWKIYQLHVNAKITKQYADMVHKNFPGRIFNSCNTLLKKGEKYPVDVDRRLFDRYVDIHQPMCYSSGTPFFDRVGYNISIPGKPFHVLVDPTEHYELYYKRYNPLEVGRDIVVSAALGAYGFRFYPADNFDARYLQPIADAYGTVRKLEKFYKPRKQGKGITLTPENVVTTRFNDNGMETSVSFPDAGEFIRHTVHDAADGEKLLTVLNYSKKHNMIFRVKASGFTVLYDPIHRVIYPAADIRNGALIEVPALGTGYLVFGKKLPAGTWKAVSQEQLKKRLTEEKKRLASANLFTEQKKGSSGISFSRLPDTGSAPMMKLQSNQFRIYIDCMNGGDVISWKRLADAQDDILFANGVRGFLGRPIWADNTQDRQAPYAFRMLKSGFEADGSPYADFIYTVPQYDNVETAVNPLLGLETVKRISLREGGKKIVIRFTFTNKNELKKTIPLEFRINNAPIPGKRLLGSGRTPGRITEIGYLSPKGPAALTVSAPENTYLVRVPRTDKKQHKAEKEWKFSPVTVTAKAEGMSEGLTILPPDKGIAGIYSWRGVALCTVEPYSEVIPLAPGAKKIFTVEFARE